MSLAIGSLATGPLHEWVHGAPLARRAEAASYPQLITRNETSGDTVNVFLDSQDTNMKYAASIVEACKEVTVYAVRCTNSVALVGSMTCGPSAAEATVTIGSSTFEFSSDVATTTRGIALKGVLIETCVLDGTTAATCAATVQGTARGASTSAVTTLTREGSFYHRFDMTITGGAEKTANPTGSCEKPTIPTGTSSGGPPPNPTETCGANKNAACGAGNAAPGLSAKTLPLWALAAVVGAAGVLLM